MNKNTNHPTQTAASLAASPDLHGTYTFTRPRWIAYIILLIPLTFLILLAYASVTLPSEGQSSVLPYISVVGIGFGLIAMRFVLPKITISNGMLTQRNCFGYTSNPVNLVTLTSMQAVRKYVSAGGYIVRVWALKLTDETGNSTTVSLSTWKNEATLKRIIASSPTGSNVDVNDAAAKLLDLGQHA